MPRENQGETETIIITDEEAGNRLDKILANRYGEVKSRTYFQNLIGDHCVLVNGEPVKKRLKPIAGDEVEICFVLTPEIGLKPEPIPLSVIYEDDHILAVNKPFAMVVHPAPGNFSGTFVNALLYHCKQLPGDPSSLRPGIVHRLDKNTSGVLIAAKTSLAHQRLVAAFASRKVYKEYLAVCVGVPGEGTISLPLGRHPVHRKKMAVVEGGKEAITHYQTIASDGALSLVKVVIETGRTHQIRVHLKAHGTPVLGDEVYGSRQRNQKYGVKRHMLHAYKIRFDHPITEEPVELTAEIPSDMAHFANRLKKEHLP